MEIPELVTVVLASELLIEILSWLPVKSLMRFKCVSKSWKSLISEDKNFTKLHLERSPTINKHVILSLKGRRFITCSVSRLFKDPLSMIEDNNCLSFEEEVGYTCAIGSCNGLVCLLGFNDGGRVWFRLWNPATRLRFHKSPIFPCGCSVVNFGFGYDSSCDTYKVMVVLSKYNGHHGREWIDWKFVTTVHSMGDSCWREILSVPGPIELDRMMSGLFAGGCVNWLANHKLKGLVIVSFDMCKETYRVLSLQHFWSSAANGKPRAHVKKPRLKA